MNNDTNNNLNGTVLGSVNNTNLNNGFNQMPNSPVETLDSNFGNQNPGITGSQVVNNNPISSQDGQNTFFNNPPVNGMSQPNQGMVNEVPNVQPSVEPAYTNPQSINPAPMPGFENSNMIGTTPPISFEPEKKPKKKGDKILFIIIVLLALAGVGFGTYYVLNYTDLLNNIQKEQVNVTTNNLEINVGDSLSTSIADYATITGTDTRNCSLNTNNVDVTKQGTYEYQVTCGETVKTGIVTVVDNTELVVNTKKVYKVKNDTLKASEFALNTDENLTYEFVDQTAVDSLLTGEYGTYIVKIKVTSQSGKTIEVDGTLVLIEYAIKGHLICTSKEQNITDSSAVMTVSEKFAIVNDGKNGYGNIAYEIHTFKFSDETEYTTYLASYKNNNEITINNITGDTSFNDEELTITITNEKDNNVVINEYGLSNMEKYSSIKSYFSTTLGYTCTYKLVENE